MQFNSLEQLVSHVEQHYSINGRPCLQLACAGYADEHWQVWTCRPDFSADFPPDFVATTDEDSGKLILEWHPDSRHDDSPN